jgi:hypothetical protein
LTADWIRLHNEELLNLDFSPNIIRRRTSVKKRWTLHVARMRANRNAYRILVGNPEGKRPLGRPSRRWVNSIKWILDREDVVVWTGSIWLRIGTSGEFL